MSRHKLCVATGFWAGSGLGRDRAWPWEEVLRARQTMGMHDKGMGATEEFCQDREFYVSTEFHLEERIGVAT